MSFPKKNKILLLLVLVVLIAFAGYRYVMQPPASVASKNADFTGTAATFITQVREDAAKWSGKVVVLQGSVTSKDGLGIQLDEKIFCQFDDNTAFPSLKTGQKVKIKGLFLGYDDLMDELSVNECQILE